MSQAGGQIEVGGEPSRVRFQVVAFLCVLSFLTYYDRQCIVRAQESLQKTVSISDDQMGLVFGAIIVASAVGLAAVAVFMLDWGLRAWKGGPVINAIQATPPGGR